MYLNKIVTIGSSQTMLAIHFYKVVPFPKRITAYFISLVFVAEVLLAEAEGIGFDSGRQAVSQVEVVEAPPGDGDLLDLAEVGNRKTHWTNLFQRSH